MPIALHLDNTFWEIGSSSFLNSFFSTVSVHLEPNGFGTRFPRLKELYDDGHLPAGLADQASGELNEARRELSRLTPDRVTWDSDDRQAKPPWGSNISPDITDLSNYFLTSDGRDLFEVLLEALAESEDSGQPLRIE